MGNTKHRKKHKQKLAAFKNKAKAQKNQYTKAVQAHIDMIKEQMAKQQTEKLDLTQDFNMTAAENLSFSSEIPDHVKKQIDIDTIPDAIILDHESDTDQLKKTLERGITIEHVDTKQDIIVKNIFKNEK